MNTLLNLSLNQLININEFPAWSSGSRTRFSWIYRAVPSCKMTRKVQKFAASGWFENVRTNFPVLQMQKVIPIMQNDFLIWKVPNQSVIGWYFQTQAIVAEQLWARRGCFCRILPFQGSIFETLWVCETRLCGAFFLGQTSHTCSPGEWHFYLRSSLLHTENVLIWPSCNHLVFCKFRGRSRLGISGKFILWAGPGLILRIQWLSI